MHIKINNLDRKGYRKFGLVTGFIVAVLFGLLLPWLFSFSFPYWPWIVTGVLFLLGILAPMALQPIYRVWMEFGLVMNWINTRLILGLLFYGLFLPIGLVFKVIGRDSLNRRIDSAAHSYRQPASDDNHDNMEHPY